MPGNSKETLEYVAVIKTISKDTIVGILSCEHDNGSVELLCPVSYITYDDGDYSSKAFIPYCDISFEDDVLINFHAIQSIQTISPEYGEEYLKYINKFYVEECLEENSEKSIEKKVLDINKYRNK